jgi:hypothetical protein
MDHIRACDVYPTTRCNCPERTCRRQQSEDEVKLQKKEIKQAKQRFIDDLIAFQLFLKDKGYINDYDWAYEDEALKFYNQTKAYESDKSWTSTRI